MRELNPNLFDTSGRPEWSESPAEKAVVPVDTQAQRQMQEMARQIKMLESLVSEQKVKLEDQAKNHRVNMEAVVHRLQQVETGQVKHLRELDERLGQIISHVSERRSVDQKMEEMIDRHNNIVQNFELKLKVLQKVLADRELQILKAVSMVEEARAEIVRMKRL